MPKVTFIVEDQDVEAPSGDSIREIARRAGIDLNRDNGNGFSCCGHGLCGTCRVWVRESGTGALSPATIREHLHGATGTQRLACQARVLADVNVTTVAGGNDRLSPTRSLVSPPQPTVDPSVPRKTHDEAPSGVHPFGHPAFVGNGQPNEAAHDAPTACAPNKADDVP